MFSFCPICHKQVLSDELQWHANSHFEENELNKDAELARQIQISPPSPLNDIPIEYIDILNQEEFDPTSQASSSNSNTKSNSKIDQRISTLTKLQLRSEFHLIQNGIMNLLRTNLLSEGENCTSIISGHVDHFQTLISEDQGWGCGFRNIQILSSNLIHENYKFKKVLFGGSGFVPKISDLQKWLEIAWELGFDKTGSYQFENRVFGTKKWIGTTECAAIFRSFGLRARIVDFDSTESQNAQNNNKRGKRVRNNEYGPMDKFVKKEDQNENRTNVRSDDLIEKRGREVLIDWVWKYFTDTDSKKFDVSKKVTISEKTPLYFQHDGHSRTIVGIQMKKGMRGSDDQFFLLILDPGHKTVELERTLRSKKGWQGLIKRGPHTLKKPQYQLCYIDPGIAGPDEMERLKIIDSTLVRF
ncbi:hypothetical protein LUZ60_007258 [Juncus effusus]|nr:hypothetical protein LUZ60_007258 [Juncus effusus]